MNQQISRAFRQLYLGRRTGVLIGEAKEAKRSIIFKSGLVVGARSSLRQDRLGEVMVRHGRITAQHLEDASHFIKSGRKLGQILVELRLLGEEEIERFVRIQLLDIACAILIDPHRRLSFSDLAAVEGVAPAPLSVADILMEAARRTPRIQSHLKALRGDKRKLGLASDPLLRFQSVSLTPEEAFILSRIDGKEPPRAVFALSPLSEERTARTLLGLLEAGIIQPEGEESRLQLEEAARRPPAETSPVPAASDAAVQAEIDLLFQLQEKQDHWQVLGLERGASVQQIKQAFYEKARRYHPDRYRRIADPDFQEKLSSIFQRVGEAFSTLSQEAQAGLYHKLAEKEPQYEEQKKAWTAPATPPEKRGPEAAPPAKSDPREARGLYLRAKKTYERKDYWEAIQLCRRAIELEGDRAEYFHLLGLALAQNPKWRIDAEQNLKIATNLDSWKPEYFVSLGELYRREGLLLRARRMFEQAKAIDPAYPVPEMN